jgi:hypothetical protein
VPNATAGDSLLPYLPFGAVSGGVAALNSYLHLHSLLVRLPGNERETPEHFCFQRRIHQLLRDDQRLDLGRGLGARVFEHRKELLRIGERTAIAEQGGMYQIRLVAGL